MRLPLNRDFLTTSCTSIQRSDRDQSLSQRQTAACPGLMALLFPQHDVARSGKVRFFVMPAL
jgi:hypothetical protein